MSSPMCFEVDTFPGMKLAALIFKYFFHEKFYYHNNSLQDANNKKVTQESQSIEDRSWNFCELLNMEKLIGTLSSGNHDEVNKIYF